MQEGLLPIPNALLNDSLLLGGITKATLGPSGAQSLFVHPYVIGGWCGLVATALNCLPVGCLDGGRIMQARAPAAGGAAASTSDPVAAGLGNLGLSLVLGRQVLAACQRMAGPTALFLKAGCRHALQAGCMPCILWPACKQQSVEGVLQ